MEKSVEISVTPKKPRKTRSKFENDATEDKSNNETETVILNGTGNTKEEAPEEDSRTNQEKLIKISKVSKTSKSPLKDTAKTTTIQNKKTTEILPEIGSPSSSSLSEDFCGFDILSESDEQIKNKKALETLIRRLEDNVDEEKESEEETESEAMTVEDADAADSDSNQMEIDEGNSHADSAEFSDKNEKRTKESDMDNMETDSVKSGEGASETTEEEVKIAESTKEPDSDQPKVEYCGTCNLVVDDAEEGICCDGKCERWFHLRCSGLTQTEYNELSRDENAKWACSRCSGKPPPVIKPGAKPLLTVRKDLTAIETPSPKRKMTSKEEKRPRVDISNPIYLKPFDYGWKRELVYRSTTDSASKKQGDVYYYTPKGKKLRSLREIGDYLVGTDLSVDNFTFWKDALGCDPEKEIIRDAKIKLSKDASASPAPIVKKQVTPKTPKTPKVPPKLTATVTPLDSASGLPVLAKASASVTPRVVLKAGKTGSISSGPKFKVTPSKATTPGQPTKIVISKDGETTGDEQPFNIDTTKSCRGSKECLRSYKENNQIVDENLINGLELVETTEEEDEVVPRKKTFRRCGLLANRVLTRSNVYKRMSSSTSSGGKEEEITTPEKVRPPRHLTQFDVMKATGLEPRENTHQSKAIIKKPASSSTPTSPFRGTPSLLHGGIPPPSPNKKRPRSPEMQFRPSDPSSYGCQTVVPTLRPMRSNITGIPSSFEYPYETVFIVDTNNTTPSQSSISPESVLGTQRKNTPPKHRNGPASPEPVSWTQDCSIEVFSVETLQANAEFSNENHFIASSPLRHGLPPKKQSATIRAVEENRIAQSSQAANKALSSPESDRGSIRDVIMIDEDEPENSLPPFMSRDFFKPERSPNRCPPYVSPPPLLTRQLPIANPSLDTGTIPVITISSPGSSTSSCMSRTDLSMPAGFTESGSKYEEYRKMKRDRFILRAKAKREMQKLRKSYLKEKKEFLKTKSDEKKLEVEYLRLKVKIKNMKLSMIKKRIVQE